MADEKEQELLKSMLRVRTLLYVVRLFITAKITGFEDEFMNRKFSMENEHDMWGLDNFYANRIIEGIFKDD